jgi:hypothetical protein
MQRVLRQTKAPRHARVVLIHFFVMIDIAYA